MVVLDITIANVSVPHIAGGLAVSPSQGTWVITSYAVAEAISVPLTGWLAQRFGAVRVFVVRDARLRRLFSVLCGLSPTLGMLVACPRAAGPVRRPDDADVADPAAAHLPARRRRGTAHGLWAMTTLVGADRRARSWAARSATTIGWPWIFFINVPVALICAFGWPTGLLQRPTETRRRASADRLSSAWRC